MKDDVKHVGVATIGTGAALTAAVASACCVGPALGPLFLAIFGASGLVAVAGLRPYAPLMFIVSAAMLAFAFRGVFFRPQVCAPGAQPPSPSASLMQRAAKILLFAATLLWITAVSYSIYGYLHE